MVKYRKIYLDNRDFMLKNQVPIYKLKFIFKRKTMK